MTTGVTTGVLTAERAPAAPVRRASAWPDAAAAVLLYAAAAAWFLWLAAGASAQGVIAGEEASITHRDALSVALRWQPSIWSTNFGSQFFYAAAAHVAPGDGLLWARPVKAVAVALLAPLCFLVARRRLGCGRPAAVLAGVAVAALPGVAVVAWVGTENGLEAVWGVAALLVATSARRGWPVAPVLAAVAVSNYTAGLAWALVVVAVCLARVRSVRTGLAVAAGVAAGIAVVLAPLLWWRNGGIVVTGGGRGGFDPGGAPARLAQLAAHAVRDGSSYYYFSAAPVLVSTLVAGLLAACALVALAARWRPVAPWLAVAVACAGLYAVSGNVTGSRRVVALAVVGALVLAVAADVLVRWEWLPGKGSAPIGPRHPLRRWAGPLIAVVLAAVVVIPAGAAVVDTRAELRSGTRALPIDWPFPVDPGGTQTSTLARLDTDLRAGRLSVDQVGDGWGGTRTLAMLITLAQRRGAVPPLRTDQLLTYYRHTDDCRLLDGPVCS